MPWTLGSVQRRFPSRQHLATKPRRPPADLRQVLAGHLKERRAAHGLTQEALALAANLDRTFLSLLENGRVNVSVDSLCKLAAVLDVEPYELIKP